jgi:hypothetical protein
MAKRVLRAWRGVVLAAVAGCSSGSGASDVTASQACADFATTNCQKLQACAPSILQTDYGDLATCAARFQLACPPGPATIGSTWKPGALEGCSRSLEAQTCTDYLTGYLSGESPGACALTGSIPLGSSCAVDSQCASGFCQTLAANSCGACATRSPVGGACAYPADCEQTGLTCVGGSCVPLAVLGAECDETHPCQPLLYCSANGMCVARLGLGATCDSTIPNPCDLTLSLTCSLDSKCVVAPIASIGAPCGSTAGGAVTVCESSGECLTPGGSTLGTCQAAAADGTTCNPTLGPYCMPPAACLGAECTILDPATCH